ncbi:MAG: LEA type 2 family protein [Halioglobus sp.]|nr:LEA type 2 family protein [Halioglobus sp.]
MTTSPKPDVAIALILLWSFLLTACAGIVADRDPPKVSLASFRSLPVESGAPRFEITLHVINPNAETLDIAGISYSIAIMDKELIVGVANDIAPIEGYGEGEVTLDAGLQLFEFVRLFTGLGDAGSKPLTYRFKAKIDFHGLMPTQRIEDVGEITLN